MWLILAQIIAQFATTLFGNEIEGSSPVGSEVSVTHLIPNKSLEKLNSLENDFESSRS